MGLNLSTGNMYSFVTHTWNTIKGACPHDCSYCYMKRWGTQRPARFDEKELKTDLGNGNFIFVGSSCDMFAYSIDVEWVIKTLDHCRKFDNKYLFQTKNPVGFNQLGVHLPDDIHLCTTIETNRIYPQMGNCPPPGERAQIMGVLSEFMPTFVTIEPIMDFDMDEMVELILTANPRQVNIGADSGNNKLPQPTKDKVIELASRLSRFTVIHNKSNLHRLL
jgi:DNA repair photolyase